MNVQPENSDAAVRALVDVARRLESQGHLHGALENVRAAQGLAAPGSTLSQVLESMASSLEERQRAAETQVQLHRQTTHGPDGPASRTTYVPIDPYPEGGGLPSTTNVSAPNTSDDQSSGTHSMPNQRTDVYVQARPPSPQSGVQAAPLSEPLPQQEIAQTYQPFTYSTQYNRSSENATGGRSIAHKIISTQYNRSSENATGGRSIAYKIIGLLLILILGGAAGYFLIGKGASLDSRIVGTWVKSSDDGINCCTDTIAVLQEGDSLEFRQDGFVDINSSTFKYRWRGETQLIIEYPLSETVYDAALSSDGNNLHLEEQWSPSTRFTYELVRGGTPISTRTSSEEVTPSPTEEASNFRTLSGHSDHVYSVAFSSDGQTLASGSGDETIKLWSVATGEELRTLSGHRGHVVSVAFSPDGQTLASGSSDNTIKLWNVATGQEIRTLGTLSRYSDTVRSVTFSPDGQTLASGSQGGITKLWSVATGQEIRTLSVDIEPVPSVTFSPDGQTLASGSRGGFIGLWSVATGQEIHILFVDSNSGVFSSGVFSVAFSPDGQTLASGSQGGIIKLWSVATGQEIRTLPVVSNSGVFSVTFSPDGQTLALRSDYNEIKLWSVK